MSVAYVVIAILGLALLMVVHEGGHYLAARRFGMRVTKFSIGFGPTLWKHRPKNSPTTFQVAIIPFLAYVQIAGMNPLEEIDPADPDAIVVGRHGLVVEQGMRRGLLLPQVAPEWGWTRDEFLRHTCRKAGLPLDAWQHGARVYRFEADVFGESDSPEPGS